MKRRVLLLCLLPLVGYVTSCRRSLEGFTIHLENNATGVDVTRVTVVKPVGIVFEESTANLLSASIGPSEQDDIFVPLMEAGDGTGVGVSLSDGRTAKRVLASEFEAGMVVNVLVSNDKQGYSTIEISFE